MSGLVYQVHPGAPWWKPGDERCEEAGETAGGLGAGRVPAGIRVPQQKPMSPRSVRNDSVRDECAATENRGCIVTLAVVKGAGGRG